MNIGYVLHLSGHPLYVAAVKKDSLFYRLFQTLPRLFFELLGQPVERADTYRFTAVELKQTAFRLDGVFVPPDTEPTWPLFFVEVQFQRDPVFYSRFFAELFLYLRQNQSIHPWQAMVLYPSRTLDPGLHPHYQALLTSPQVHRVYLDEWAAPRKTLLQRLMGLVLSAPNETGREARAVVAQVRRESIDRARVTAILEVVETILAYKLRGITRKEIAAMLELPETDLKQTGFYQEAFSEGRQEGRQEGEAALILRLLQRRCGSLPETLIERIRQLSLPQLEALGDALLQFHSSTEVEEWLTKQA
jgi:predicted transposase/invertase (TIGR01784 family)